MNPFFFLILIASVLASCSNAPSTKTSGGNTNPETKTGSVSEIPHTDSTLKVHTGSFRIYPIDQTNEDASLKQFVSRLKKSIKHKNLPEFISCLDTGIVVSHGGGMFGIATFLDEWKRNQHPEKSALWSTMHTFLKMGGAWKDHQKTEFCFPYTQADRLFEGLNSDLDWYVTAVCTSPRTEVYEKASFRSKQIALLAYEVVEIIERGDRFIHIRTLDNHISGFVNAEQIILSADSYPILQKVDGAWKIVSFAPFD